MKKGIEYADKSWNNNILILHTQSLSGEKMNEDYIAGFFDGEGSAMIMTVKRKKKFGAVYRFRPVISIAQKHRKILDEIKNYLQIGHIDLSRGMYKFVVNGLDDVLTFTERITPYCYGKSDKLLLVEQLARFQKERRHGSTPYRQEECLLVLDLRDELFRLNSLNRDGLKQKYPRDVVLKEHKFYTEDEWGNILVKQGKHLVEYAGRYNKKPRIKIKCACGCGQILTTPNEWGRDKKYIQGHNKREKKSVQLEKIECHCGCGNLIPNQDKRGRIRKFVRGHNRRFINV